MELDLTEDALEEGGSHGSAGRGGPLIAFDALYDEHFAFVWRNLRRLGVVPSSLDDAAQDVFLVLHRRLADVDVSSPRAWLFGVVRRVAADHRRVLARKGTDVLDDAVEPRGGSSGLARRGAESPLVVDGERPLARADAARLVRRILAALDDDKREVFVLAELEQLTAPEIARAIDVPLNTVYSRLRAARQAFEVHAARLRATEEKGS